MESMPLICEGSREPRFQEASLNTWEHIVADSHEYALAA